MFDIQKRLFLSGLIIWIAGTLGMRLAGQRLLHPGRWMAILALFAITFPLMAWLGRRLCRSSQRPPEQWAAGAVSLVLPTLLLDPFSSAFFPVVFPNIVPEAAGLFGGWMLWCCAGALVGASIRR